MLITFEGPIGAGKTTLAKLLARHWNASVLLEDFSGNTFLADFYSDRQRWALPMQCWFLSARVKQFREADDLHPKYVADHSIQKDRVFAHTLLQGRELDLYRLIFDEIRPASTKSDLVIMLDASNDILLERIAKRGRAYESGISADYLEEIRTSYAANYQYETARIMRIDTTHLDISNPEELNELLDSIVSEITCENSVL